LSPLLSSVAIRRRIDKQPSKDDGKRKKKEELQGASWLAKFCYDGDGIFLGEIDIMNYIMMNIVILHQYGL